MTNWTDSELARIAASDDLHVAPFRDDGKTTGTLTWIWSVVVDGSLYARAYHGPASRWHKAAVRQKAGRITIAGLDCDVSFEPASAAVLDQIDEAYRVKYKSSQYLAPMIATGARAATVRIVPADPAGNPQPIHEA